MDKPEQSFRTFETIVEKQKSDKDDTAKAVISTRTLDRHGTIVECKGVDITYFMTNPVVLYAHGRDSAFGSLPIGTCLDINVKRESILAEWRWATPQENPRAQLIQNQWDSGLLRAVSIGFLALEVEEIEPEEGKKPTSMWGSDVRITKSELLEYSVVPTPSNRHALKRESPDELTLFLATISNNFTRCITALETSTDMTTKRLDTLERLVEQALIINTKPLPAVVPVDDVVLVELNYDDLITNLQSFIAMGQN